MTERFMCSFSSAKTRRCHSLAASFVAAAPSSSWVTPTRQHSPALISPTAAPSSSTRARVTRCTRARISPA